MADVFAPLRDLFVYVSEMESSIEMRGSFYVHPWVTVTHVIGMCVFAGTILMMDLRLFGIGNMRTPFSQVQRRLYPWQIGGMAVSAITGVALVLADRLNYFGNRSVWPTILARVVAARIPLAQHFTTERSPGDWGAGGQPRLGAKLGGGVSSLLWVAVIVAGRLIPHAN